MLNIIFSVAMWRVSRNFLYDPRVFFNVYPSDLWMT
jgi:hypothetical protein